MKKNVLKIKVTFHCQGQHARAAITLLEQDLFIYLKFSKHVKNSEHKIVGQKTNKRAAWHCWALNLIKSR